MKSNTMNGFKRYMKKLKHKYNPCCPQGSGRGFLFLLGCFRRLKCLCSTFFRIYPYAPHICPISGFNWFGVDFLAYRQKVALWGLCAVRMEV